jgi:antitoxin ParD1/3/4
MRMPDIQKVSVALTGEQLMALKAAVETGEYATTSEAVREALREWQWKRELRGEDLKRLREDWREGKASGRAIPLDLAEARREARRRLKRYQAESREASVAVDASGPRGPARHLRHDRA